MANTSDTRQCVCLRPHPSMVYDANGWKRWCGGCGGALWEVEYHESGSDVPWWLWVFFVVAGVMPVAGVVMLLLFFMPIAP